MNGKEENIEALLQEMTQNSYDLLGDIIAAQCLCSCSNVQDYYPAEVISYYRNCIADYMKQHNRELTTLCSRAVAQLKSVGDTLLDTGS